MKSESESESLPPVSADSSSESSSFSRLAAGFRLAGVVFSVFAGARRWASSRGKSPCCRSHFAAMAEDEICSKRSGSPTGESATLRAAGGGGGGGGLRVGQEGERRMGGSGGGEAAPG